MSFRNLIALAAAGWAGGCFCQNVLAQEWYSPSRTNQAPQVSLRNGEIIGSTPVRRAYINLGTNVFVLVIPEDFRMDASNPEKIVLVNSDYDCFLTVRIVTSTEAMATQPDSCRATVLNRYPGAQIVNEFSQMTANRMGPGFDLQLKTPEGVPQSARVAFIPFTVGVLEFSAVTRSNNTARGQYLFNFLMQSFRTNEGGKLVINPFSDKS